ncbi:MAG: DegT/DnrJ/EryC1/StrS family aminotransferase [Odoribacter sp.]|nr:DegT/DnrJ/EryC1/StrS family aminotransferase [Odoribacter sp.]
MQFRDLGAQYQVLKADIDAGIENVIFNTAFVSGSQVKELEQKLAEYVGVKHCITCANGTDAITLGLMIWKVGLGDAVFVPDFTFFSSGECPAALGATPIFVDVDKQTFNMDPVKLDEAISRVKEEGKYKPRVVIAVDLFGQPADYDAIKSICEKYGLLLLEDAAQGFGGSIRGKKACSFGDISITSFFQAKPLGCYGDGGALFTDNDEWAALLRSYCVHGKDKDDKYNNIRIGMNSRLDTIQAAILLPKLRAFEQYEIDDVNKVASWYDNALKDIEVVPQIIKDGYISSWAQYTIRIESNRDGVQRKLKEHGIPSMVYYPKPMHKQGAFEGTDSEKVSCPVAEELSRTVLSLPMHPYLNVDTVNTIAAVVKRALG